MRVVGITGGIASGKSTVTKMLGERGAQTRSADEDARTVLADGSPTLAQVLAAFPEARVSDAGGNGTLNRAALAARIFADPTARRTLEVIMHPPIRARIRSAVESARADASLGVLAYEVPLLLEGGPELVNLFDTIIAVVTSSETQVERLQERERIAGRPPLSPAAIAERLAAQLPADEKARRADYVIHTEGTLEETRTQVGRLWDSLLMG